MSDLIKYASAELNNLDKRIASLEAENERLNAIIENKSHQRCNARVVNQNAPPPGPPDPTIVCAKKAGHEGDHQWVMGLHRTPYRLRATDAVEEGEPMSESARIAELEADNERLKKQDADAHATISRAAETLRAANDERAALKAQLATARAEGEQRVLELETEVNRLRPSKIGSGLPEKRAQAKQGETQ